MDPLIHVLVSLALMGLFVYLISLTPIPPDFQRLIQIVAIIGVILWLLARFNLFHL